MTKKLGQKVDIRVSLIKENKNLFYHFIYYICKEFIVYVYVCHGSKKEKDNIPVHNETDQTSIENCRPISILPTSCKI